ncbi:MAG: ABC transporter substrate-binding protein [Deltaproteobacteria bacterium]|nr:ABC transporter substrate-binding protein [Deltaproteobacteria bacterium]
MMIARGVLFILALAVGSLPRFDVSAGEPIRIAAIYALSGPAAASNASSLDGTRLAVREVNRSGGVLGRPLLLVEIDNLSTPIGSKVAADEAVRQGVTAILGAAWSSHSLAIARVAQKHAIPMITNMSTHPGITRIGDCVFRVCFTDPFQGRVMARFALEHVGARDALIIKDLSSDYSLGLAREFRRNFEKGGGRVGLELDYKHSQENFHEIALQARQARPGIIFIPGHDESGAIIRETIQSGVSTVFLGGDGWVGDSFLDRGGRFLEKGFYCTHWDEKANTETSRRFVDLARGSRGPGAGLVNASEALAFDSVMLVADALKRAGSTDGEALRRALSDTRAFEGVTGSISFNEHGDPFKRAVIMEVSKGSTRYLETVTLNRR